MAAHEEHAAALERGDRRRALDGVAVEGRRQPVDLTALPADLETEQRDEEQGGRGQAGGEPHGEGPARPGRIVRELNVNLPRPRVAAETFGHPEHVKIAREIRGLLEGGDAP